MRQVTVLMSLLNHLQLILPGSHLIINSTISFKTLIHSGINHLLIIKNLVKVNINLFIVLLYKNNITFPTVLLVCQRLQQKTL